jgi:hypothetical protein
MYFAYSKQDGMDMISPERRRELAEKACPNFRVGRGTLTDNIERAFLELEKEVREECAKVVPNTWLDPLLTGPGAILKGTGPYTGTDIENLLRAVGAAIRSQP